MAGKTETGGGAADPAAIGHHGHLAQFKDFVNAVKKGTKPAIDGKEGRKAVEIILAIYKAAESGKTVSLPLPADPTLKARKKVNQSWASKEWNAQFDKMWWIVWFM
ncbi:MAG: hypothetical protein R3C28_10275 [Pirellulaceae bacterium]